MKTKINTSPYVPNLSYPLLEDKTVGLDIIPVTLISRKEAKANNIYTSILIRDSLKGISNEIPKSPKVVDYQGNLDLCSLPGFESRFGLSWEDRILNGKLMGGKKPQPSTSNYIFSKVTLDVGKLTKLDGYRTYSYHVYESLGNSQRGSHLHEAYDCNDSYCITYIRTHLKYRRNVQIYIGREGIILPKKILLLSLNAVDEFIKVVKPMNRLKEYIRGMFIAQCKNKNEDFTGLLITLQNFQV